MGWLAQLTGYVAPLFIVMSPIIYYGDQVLSMHRSKSSAGFSLDIPLIMLIASLFRIFYYPGAHYDFSLLLQSVFMVGVQLVLLKVALDHRPSPSTKGGESGLPFAGANDSVMTMKRPYNFWQWRSPKPYWQSILYLFIGLVVCEALLSSAPSVYPSYSNAIGCLGLAVEATLPLPQIFANASSKSCKGLRLSVLAAWIGGDAMKLFWFFTATTEIPWAFKISGLFQGSCDALLGIQYLMYDSDKSTPAVKEHPLEEGQWSTTTRAPSMSYAPARRPVPYANTEME